MSLVLALYVLVVIFVSLLPSKGISLWNIDKMGHFLAYAGMAILALMTFNSETTRILALLSAIALGAALEWAQSFVPGRDMSLIDGIANTLGILSGTLLFHLRGQYLTERFDRFM
ncbi:MAG: VanZ family protein [Anaerolineae bacterium]